MELECGWAVLVVVRVNGAQEAEFIGNGGGVREEVGDGDAGLASWTHGDVGAECEQALGAFVAVLFGEGSVDGGSVMFLDEGFRIEEVHL